MILFKSCTRCSGDRTLEHDYYGWYILCLLCGYVSYPNVKIEAQEPVQADRKTA